jgi:hypothetical protein
MTPKENRNENLPKLISGIFGKKFMGTHCNALLACVLLIFLKINVMFGCFLRWSGLYVELLEIVLDEL